jgi:hypothetical protein
MNRFKLMIYNALGWDLPKDTKVKGYEEYEFNPAATENYLYSLVVKLRQVGLIILVLFTFGLIGLTMVGYGAYFNPIDRGSFYGGLVIGVGFSLLMASSLIEDRYASFVVKHSFSSNKEKRKP